MLDVLNIFKQLKGLHLKMAPENALLRHKCSEADGSRNMQRKVFCLLYQYTF